MIPFTVSPPNPLAGVEQALAAIEPAEAAQRLAVCTEALSWLGTRFHHAGRAKQGGVDCGMLVAEVYERTGTTPHLEFEPYVWDWGFHSPRERFLEQCALLLRPVEHPLPGDVALFKYGMAASHIAIVLDWPRVVHAFVHQGVVLEDALANVDLGSRLVGFWSPWGKQ